jgi:hypothetical protein
MKAYLVQLRYPFRFESNGWQWVERKDGHFYRLFGSAKTALPLWLNPFDVGAQICVDETLRVHYNMDIERHDKNVPWRRRGPLISIPLVELHERACATELEPLTAFESQEQRHWQAWWELMTATMTWPEQARLRRALGLLPWLPDPFDYQHVWIDNDALNFHPFHEYCTFGWVVKGLKSLGLSPPGPNDQSLWQHWWAETEGSMADGLRDLIWWLLMPYPYQIVEVELESGR